MKSVYALIPAALLAGTILAAPAYAKKGEDPGVHSQRVSAQKKHFKSTTAKRTVKFRKSASLKVRKKTASLKSRKYAQTKLTRKVTSTRQLAALKMSGNKMTMSDQALNINGAGDQRVAQIIRDMAPSYGVPTWFALRIANVESGYNPNVRGSAGEFGVYQLKCPTARGIGFSGECTQLFDARTNVQWGLKHLSLAIKSSGGDLKLAASKHNGGLGRKSLVSSYVAKVF